MGVREDLYNVVLVLHLVTIIVGIGPPTLNGLYGAAAKRVGGAGAAAIGQANLSVTLVAEKFIYAIPITGLLLVYLSDGAFDLGQTWIWLSLVIYVAAIGISHGVLMPSAKRMIALGPELGAGRAEAIAEAGAIEKRLAGASTALHLMSVVLLALMVWKPGF